MGDAPKYSFGHRPITLEEATPGPLDYTLLKMKADEPRAPSFKIGLKAKDSIYTVNDFPSAASYYPKLENTGKTVTLKGAKNDQKNSIGPGKFYINKQALQIISFPQCLRPPNAL
jgi:hypothetical protein